MVSAAPAQDLFGVHKIRDRAYVEAMKDKPEVLIECATADEADRALGLGLAIEATPEVAAECGAPEPGEPDPVDSLEDVIEAYLHPHGDDRETGSR